MISHLHVDSYEQNARIAFVINTICDWYGWSWSYGSVVHGAGGLGISYGRESSPTSAFSIDSPFPISDIGKPNSCADWGSFKDFPNPCFDDPIAGVFYLLTCAEEYTITQRDPHDRVPANDLSIVKRGHETIPLADRLVEVLAKAVWEKAGLKETPVLKPEQGYSSLDIDQVYAVKHKPLYKQFGSLARSVLSRDWIASQFIIRAILGGEDPFDSFDWIKGLHEQRGLKPYFFLLMGYENATDPAWKPGHSQWPILIDRLRSWSRIGIHPSYRAATEQEVLEEEKQRLEGLIGESIQRARQHFLKVSWPETFQLLVASGVTEDYTLAWPDRLGFRMGTARSCFWYDLSKDEQTALRLYPPCMMEVTGRNYLGLSPKQFLEKATQLSQEAKRSESGLRVIWHNSNLSELGDWKAWKKIYPAVLDIVVK